MGFPSCLASDKLGELHCSVECISIKHYGGAHSPVAREQTPIVSRRDGRLELFLSWLGGRGHPPMCGEGWDS